MLLGKTQFKMSDIQYSPDGYLYWEDEYKASPHYSNKYPGEQIGAHLFIRMKLDGRDYFEPPMRMIGQDGKTITLELKDDLVMWKYEEEEDHKFRLLFDPKDYVVKGDKGERGAGLDVDYHDYYENIGLYTPTQGTYTVSGGCCDQDYSHRPDVPIFMSEGLNASDPTGFGEIYSYSPKNRTWGKLPGIVSPTGELKTTVSDTLGYLDSKINNDNFIIESEKLNLKDEGVDYKHLSSNTFGYGVQYDATDEKIIVDTVGIIGKYLTTVDVNGDLKIMVNPTDMLYPDGGIDLESTLDAGGQPNTYKIYVNMEKLLIDKGGIIAEGAGSIKKIKTDTGVAIYLDVDGKVSLNYDNIVLDVVSEKVTVKTTGDSDLLEDGISGKHVHKFFADELRGLVKDLSSKKFYVAVEPTQLGYTAEGKVKILDDSITYELLDKSIFDSARGLAIDSVNKKIFVKLNDSHLVFNAEGKVTLKDDFLDTLTNTYVRTLAVDGVQYEGNIQLAGLNNNYINMQVSYNVGNFIHFQGTLNLSNLRIEVDSWINDYVKAKKIQHTDIAGLLAALDKKADAPTEGSLDFALASHTHNIADLDGSDTIPSFNTIYNNIVYTPNGTYLRLGGTTTFALLECTAGGNVQVDTNNTREENEFS